MLEGGATAVTVSGRVTGPFPKVDMSTERRSAATIRRVQRWLLDEATVELGDRGWVLGMEVPGRVPPATVDLCHVVLFGDV
jgi:hypothetical protein